MIDMTGRPIEQRVTGSAVAAAIAASHGAAILRFTMLLRRVMQWP